MVQESAQTVSLIMVTVAVLLQTMFLMAITLSVARMRKSFQQFTSDVHKFLEIAGRSVETLNLHVTQVSQTVQNRLQRAGDMTDELLVRNRRHALAFDRIVSDALHMAEHANHEIEVITGGGFRQARALNAGLRAALGELFSPHKAEGRGPRRGGREI
jgi:hypothetical protein